MSTTTGRAVASGGLIGFTCAYTPLPLIRAAGFVPYRILPLGDAPDRAGSLLHDNMCPHVKRIIDRALAGELPELAGVVVMNSCDTMRRLADAWRVFRPEDRIAVVELPTAPTELAREFFAGELARLWDLLQGWAGRPMAEQAIHEAMRSYNELARALADLQAWSGDGGRLRGGRSALQSLFNLSVTAPVETSLEAARALLEESAQPASEQVEEGVPLFVFGNVLADPASFELFARCGARVVGDDLCTGARQLCAAPVDDSTPPLAQLARAVLDRPLCARTLPGSSAERDRLAEQVIGAARASGARGVVAHVMKFCDPYLARLPAIQRRLEDEGIPLLILEGDCTTRSLGQQATRIEAFVEMLGEM